MSAGDIVIKGAHNLENILACVTVSKLAGISVASMADSIKRFRGLSHRVELVDVIDGVEYVDDSKGTTVDSTRRALELGDKSVVLIAGGRDKASDFSVMRDIVNRRVKHLILIGEAKDKIRSAVGDLTDTHDALTMEEAVKLAGTFAEKGDIVLLSPMCASFDMFKSYKHRGDVFKEAVRKLKREKK